MKKLFLLFSMLSITTFLMAQEVIGKVVDSNGKPLPYVNIVLLNTQDSTFIKGTTSGQNGDFTLYNGESYGILKLSSVGYQTLFIAYKGKTNLGKIKLLDNVHGLDAVVVKSKLPKTIIRDGGVITTVNGSILEKQETSTTCWTRYRS